MNRQNTTTTAIALSFAIATCAMTAAAGTFNWTGGAADDNWSSADNWQEQSAPSAATDVVVFNIASDTTTTFDLSVSPVIEKRGAGKLTVSGGSAYNNTVSTGSLFLYGGALDLGGGKASMKQTADGDSVLADGTALYNAIVAYSSAYNPGPCVGFKLPEGTVIFGILHLLLYGNPV